MKWIFAILPDTENGIADMQQGIKSLKSTKDQVKIYNRFDIDSGFDGYTR